MGKDSYALPFGADISFFDFALVENLDDPNSFLNGDIFDFAKRWGCPIGIAHTDLFKFCQTRGEEPFLLGACKSYKPPFQISDRMSILLFFGIVNAFFGLLRGLPPLSEEIFSFFTKSLDKGENIRYNR
jgi:hypothetical protein